MFPRAAGQTIGSPDTSRARPCACSLPDLRRQCITCCRRRGGCPRPVVATSMDRRRKVARNFGTGMLAGVAAMAMAGATGAPALRRPVAVTLQRFELSRGGRRRSGSGSTSSMRDAATPPDGDGERARPGFRRERSSRGAAAGAAVRSRACRPSAWPSCSRGPRRPGSPTASSLPWTRSTPSS